MQWIKRNWLALLFVLVNIAIASPAQAGIKNGVCWEPGGGQTECCETCYFFCGCDFVE